MNRRLDTTPPEWSAQTARENRAFNRKMDLLQIGIGLFGFGCIAIHMIEAWLR